MSYLQRITYRKEDGLDQAFVHYATRKKKIYNTYSYAARMLDV